MTRGHDLFESLAGAIALGEATSAETARFAEHAAGCERCRPDLDLVPARLAASVRDLAESESWRPRMEDGLGAAIAGRRRRGARAIGSAIAVAAAFSIALNVGFSNGALGHLIERFGPVPSDPTPVAVAPRRPSVPSARIAERAETVAAVVVPHHRHRAIVHVRSAAKPAAVAARAAVEPPMPTLDVFGGLAIDPEAEKKAPHVARADPDGSESRVTAAP